MTTAPTIEGHQIVAYLGIESAEIVIGTGFLAELSGDISDFFGQRSKGFESKLQAHQTCPARLWSRLHVNWPRICPKFDHSIGGRIPPAARWLPSRDTGQAACVVEPARREA